MEWYAWVICVLLGVNALAAIASIGRPRQPLTPGSAIAILVTNALVIWGIVSLAVS